MILGLLEERFFESYGQIRSVHEISEVRKEMRVPVHLLDCPGIAEEEIGSGGLRLARVVIGIRKIEPSTLRYGLAIHQALHDASGQFAVFYSLLVFQARGK